MDWKMKKNFKVGQKWVDISGVCQKIFQGEGVDNFFPNNEGKKLDGRRG